MRCLALFLALALIATVAFPAKPVSTANGERLAKALEEYRAANGVYPKARGEELLKVLAPYDAEVKLQDEFGNPLRYLAFGSSYFILGAGADGQSGTDDDIRIEDKNRKSMKSLAISAEAYRTDHGMYPAAKDLGELVSFIQPVYIRTAPTTDLWGTPYRYRASDQRTSFEVRSAGVDRTFDTQDDVVVQDETKSSLMSIRTAVEAYKIDYNAYPKADSVETLIGAIQPRYIMKTPKTDVWGSEIRYASSGGASFTLLSAGPDKAFGTADDIAATK